MGDTVRLIHVLFIFCRMNGENIRYRWSDADRQYSPVPWEFTPFCSFGMHAQARPRRLLLHRHVLVWCPGLADRDHMLVLFLLNGEQ